MKRKVLIGIVGLLVLALLVWAFMPTPAEVEIATVTQGRFERTVQEDGKTRLRDRYVVSTPLTGRVSRINLKQGDTVVRDATVATLWPVSPGAHPRRASGTHRCDASLGVTGTGQRGASRGSA